MADTNIPISDEVWSALNSRKSRGDTFDDVLRELLAAAADESPSTRRDTVREPVERAVAGLDWHQADVTHTAAREAALADAVKVVAVAGVCSRRTVKQIVRRSDRELGLAESSRERMAADLVPRVDGVEPEGDSDLVWTDD